VKVLEAASEGQRRKRLLAQDCVGGGQMACGVMQGLRGVGQLGKGFSRIQQNQPRGQVQAKAFQGLLGPAQISADSCLVLLRSRAQLLLSLLGYHEEAAQWSKDEHLPCYTFSASLLLLLLMKSWPCGTCV
jgi:hypothetical protein